MIFRRQAAEAEMNRSGVSQAEFAIDDRRRLGGLALRTQEAGFADYAGRFDRHLEDFEEHWTAANNLITDFMFTPETIAQFNKVVAEYSSCSSYGRRLNERDLADFVTVAVLFARINRRDEANQAFDESGTLRSTLAKCHQQLQQARGNWQAVTTVDHHTPSAPGFYRSLAALEDRLRPHYKKADRSRDKVWKGVNGFIDDQSGGGAVAFINGCQQLLGAEDSRAQALLRLLAVDLAVNDQSSAIERSLKLVEATAEEGSLLSDFLYTKSQEDDGRNWVEFTRRLFEEQAGRRESFAEYMQQKKAGWPNGLAEDYTFFVREQTAAIRRRLKSGLAAVIDPQLQPASLYELELTTERILKKIVGNHRQKTQIQAGDKSIRRSPATGSQRILPSAARLEAGRKQGLTAVTLESSGEGYQFGSVESLSESVKELSMSHPEDESYPGDLRAIIGRLVEDPFGTGVKRLASRQGVKVGNKKHTVFRFNPSAAVGLSIGVTAKQSRIVFTVADRKVGILRITDNHRDYENFFKIL